MLTAIVGTNWGDEGKGRMVDLLSSDYDIVVRFQGGNNAGHTVINEKGKFILNLLPSGILRDDTLNVMGPGMVIDIEHLNREIKALKEKGINISSENLIISDRATICMPYHKQLDGLEEDRLAGKKFGSTRRGIAPSYSDKYMKKTIRVGDLRHMDEVKEHLSDIVEWKNLLMTGGYGYEPVSAEEMYAWIKEFGTPLLPFIKNTTTFLKEMIDDGKNIMFEAQLGTLKDVDFGIIPYTTSSTTLASYAPIGAGIPFARLDRVVGIMKAYSSAVGEGPFTCELTDRRGDKLREAGGEYGAATGRPRRVGGFDVVASRYGALMQGTSEIALTKLDVLSCFEKIPVCTHYEIDGKITDEFPNGVDLVNAKPVYEEMPGWGCDITGCRSFEELPEEAKSYVEFIEEKIGCRIRYVSVGAGREQYIER